MLELRSVSLTQEQNIFGKHGKQLSATMQDIKIAFDSKRFLVVVTSPTRPGVEEWILPAIIGKLVFAEPKSDEVA